MSGRAADPKRKPREDGYSNAFWSIFKPFTVEKGIIGSASYVTVEVLVSQMIRRIMGAPYNWREAIETHTYSVPFLGQMNFGEDYADYPMSKSDKVDITEELTEGGKAIPAAVVGYTAMKLRKEGIKVPSYANRDFLYLLVGKLLSRPMLSYMFRSLPEDVEIGLYVLQELVNKQRRLIQSVKKQSKAE